jgi:hypothetical protein
LPCLSSLADIIGVMVSATMPEITTAPASVRANSRNSEPVRPPVKASGANTAASVIVMATTGPVISLMPTKAAWGGVRPSSMWRWMFSTTTMASSTTRPIASTIASNERRLIEYPIRNRKKHTPISDSGMVTIGISTERKEPRKSRMMKMTMTTASEMVRNTSRIDALIDSVASYIRVMVMPSGSEAWMAGSSSMTAEAVSSGFAAGVGKMAMKVPGRPLKLTTMSVLSAASSTSATSPSRTTSSPVDFSGRAANASGVCRVERMVTE